MLQLVCLVVITRYNDYQRHQVGEEFLQVSGGIQERRARIKSYFNLNRENDALKYENLSLHQRIAYLKSRLNHAESLLRIDSNKVAALDTNNTQKQFYKYLPARAINNSTDRNYNYITLDKGSSDGVKVGMGVISPRGIAGRIIRVSEDYSLALSLINLNFKLSVKDARTGHVGMYEWEGGSSQYGYLKYIPQQVEIRVGDSVLTSGYSSVFPEGYNVGVISDNKTIVGGFYKAKVMLATDFSALGDLYIVEAKHRQTVDSLMSGLPVD